MVTLRTDSNGEGLVNCKQHLANLDIKGVGMLGQCLPLTADNLEEKLIIELVEYIIMP